MTLRHTRTGIVPGDQVMFSSENTVGRKLALDLQSGASQIKSFPEWIT
jgi:hypothetical protein